MRARRPAAPARVVPFPADAAERRAGRARLARPSPGPVRIATVDIGSNSIHMLVAEVEGGGRIHVLDRAKERVGLGNRTLATGRLSQRAMDDGIAALRSFRMLAQRRGVARMKAVATSAVREARNGGVFLRRVQKEVGLPVKVIPGREEARLIHLGVRHGLELKGGRALIVDLGGGSVELIRVEDGEAAELHSLKTGAARLAEEFLQDDRPSARALRRLEVAITRPIEPLLSTWEDLAIERVIATSGTLLALAALAARQRPEPFEGPLNGFAVEAGEVSRLRRTLTGMSRAERLRIPGLDRTRVDQIVPAAILADALLRGLGAPVLVACTWALREGVLLDYLRRHRPGIEEATSGADLRRRSVLRFARHLGQAEEHPRHVAELAARLFAQLREPLGLPESAKEMLEHAALLHDVGHAIDHQNHHRHTHYLITHGELPGFTRDELQVLGLVAFYHRKGTPKSSHRPYAALSKPARRQVRGLAAVLRVADGLDRSHFGVVRDVTVRRRGDRLTFSLSTRGEDAALEIWEARRRANLLEKALGVEAVFRVAH
jgi:exopolyphosphatase/guanosine-5'-triphosphate,3'-diphosphate pyrophosphatase